MKSVIASVLTMLALPYILGGINVSGFGTAVAAALVLGVVNTLVRPLLKVLAFPLTMVTFGLFTFVINGAMIMLTSFFVPGFMVAGWWDAILASVIISVVNSFVFKT